MIITLIIEMSTKKEKSVGEHYFKAQRPLGKTMSFNSGNVTGRIHPQ